MVLYPVEHTDMILQRSFNDLLRFFIISNVKGNYRTTHSMISSMLKKIKI